MEEKTKYRISIIAGILLIIVAGIFELLSLIPFVSTVMVWIFWAFASIYFWKIGMGIVNGRRLATIIISVIIEIVPVLQWLPGILSGIIAIIIMTRIEDRTGISLNPMQKKPGFTPPRIQPNPLNQGGIRSPRNN